MICCPAVRSLVLAGLLGVVLACPPALASPAPTRAPAVQSLVDCRKIADAASRLACYDRSVDGLVNAETSGDLVTIDRQQRGALRNQAFGFNIPAITLLDRDKKVADGDRLVSKVASAVQDGSGRWIITLEGGAIWAQTDDAALYPDPRPGSPVVVHRGALGSFFMSIDGKPGFRAVRRG
jgi:hypothetical protein